MLHHELQVTSKHFLNGNGIVIFRVEGAFFGEPLSYESPVGFPGLRAAEFAEIIFSAFDGDAGLPG